MEVGMKVSLIVIVMIVAFVVGVFMYFHGKRQVPPSEKNTMLVLPVSGYDDAALFV